MVKHWPLRKGFANFNNELVAFYFLPHLEFKKWNGSLGKCMMFTICLFHSRFYVGWYFKSNKL